MIIAIKDGDCVHLAFDIKEWGLIGVMHDDLMLKGNHPYWIIKAKNPALMTSTYNLTARDLFRYNFPFAEIKDIKQIQLEIVPWIRKTLTEYQIIKDKEEETFESIIIAREDRLFVVDQYFFVEEIHDYIVFGGASIFAMYVLKQTAHLDPINRIRATFEKAMNYYHHCIEQFYVIDTKDFTLKTYKMGHDTILLTAV
jgi:hypothetical protein